MDDFLHAVVSRLAGFVAGTAADATAVVAGGKRASIVMSEFYDDDVVGFDEVDDFVKAAFARVGAGTAAANGFVDDGEGEGVL